MPVFRKRTSTDYIAVHCSATPPSMDIGVAEIRRWHLIKGWLDIGYHFVIRRNGVIEPGRPVDVMGAHVEGYNHNAIGICLVGGVSQDSLINPARSPQNNRNATLASNPENNFTPEQFTSLWELLKTLQNEYIDALIQGHRDFPRVAKDCPCFDTAAWIQTQKEREQHDISSTEPHASPSACRPFDTPQ